jgi:hypothetical protein
VVNKPFWQPANSLQLAHQQALTWVCDAYLFHLVSLHRRPVYRHQYGDISLNQPALQGFIDSYLIDKGWDGTPPCALHQYPGPYQVYAPE